MRPFADVVRQLNGGITYDDLTGALAEAVQATNEHRKVSEITLKLKIKSNGENSVLISSDVKVKIPSAPQPDTIFFVANGGELSREDPRQPKLPLRTIDEQPRGELKDATHGG